MTKSVAIHWLRQDLRLTDNPALSLAATHGKVLPVYILDERNAREHAMGRASRWWLHHSLASLSEAFGTALSLYRGNPINVFLNIATRYNIETVYWNRCYEPWRITRDATIKRALRNKRNKGQKHQWILALGTLDD